MYGAALARGPQGQVGAGLGQTTSTGEVGLDRADPRHHRRPARRTRSTASRSSSRWRPGTEAPAEMHFYFPQLPRAVHGRERHPHPAQPAHPARRAGARPARLVDLPDRGDRDVRRAHRRRLRLAPLADLGQRAIVDVPRRPSATSTPTCTTRPCGCSTRASPAPRSPSSSSCRRRWTNAWNTHGYYGSVSHNVKAIYQRYMGWFDGNPARLWPHPPAATGRPLRRRDRRHRPRRRARADRVRRRRLPLGGDPARPRGVRRRRARRGPRALRGHPGAARLRRRERHLAQLLPLRRHRAARGQLRHPDRDRRARDPRPAHPRAAVRLDRHLGRRPAAPGTSTSPST